MKPLRHILLTFDYELFLGKLSGTPQNCMVKPTAILQKVLKRYDLKFAIFFVDTVYLSKLKENTHPRAKADYDVIASQLHELSSEGHYLFPHIHSHWLDAEYNPDLNQWNLSNMRYYNFGAVPFAQKSAAFENSILILDEIRGRKEEFTGFRAGGWCIQPFSAMRPFFEKHGVKYDFSVLGGYSNYSEFQKFDFRNIPEKPYYPFEEYVIKEDPSGRFIEIPISTVKFNFGRRIVSKIFMRSVSKNKKDNFGDGYSIEEASKKVSQVNRMEMASIELMNKVNQQCFMSSLKKNSHLHFISHPKMFSVHNMECFDSFIQRAVKKYEISTDFKNYIKT